MSPITTLLAAMALAAIPLATATKVTNFGGVGCTGTSHDHVGHEKACKALRRSIAHRQEPGSYS